MKSKSPFASRMNWLNVAALVVASVEPLREVIPEEWRPWAAALVGAANIVLRHVTTQPVSFRR